MKTTDKATAYILVKADTNSEWDFCDFAIIHITADWKKEQAKRLEAIKPFEEDYTLLSMNYYDTAVDFYRIGDVDHPDIEELLAGKEWVFVELAEDEHKNLAVPDQSLDCYRLAVHRSGTATYKAYGKHTGEEFWTEDFDLKILCNPITAETEIEKLCMKRFKHFTNIQLIERVNSLPDFGWDDEGVELQRRRRVSNGAFDYEIRGNIMVILKDA